jgi:putative hydrolase of the HAD superfamily
MTRAVFLDALGTLVRLEPPWERIDPGAVEGIAPGEVRDAFRAEMGYYREHAHTGRDAASLAALRERCAELLGERLGRPIAVATMMDAIRFEPYADAASTLTDLHALGLPAVCVSNWDCSLPEVLERVGLAAMLAGVVTSAGAGSRKPNPAIFAGALEIAGCAPAEAVHVGDSDEDDEAALAAGIPSLRLDRDGIREGSIASLGEIVEHLRR